MYWSGDTYFDSAVGGTKQDVTVSATCIDPLEDHNQENDKSPCGDFSGCISDLEYYDSSNDACIPVKKIE